LRRQATQKLLIRFRYSFFSLLAGNLGIFRDEFELTPPSSGESANFPFLDASRAVHNTFGRCRSAKRHSLARNLSVMQARGMLTNTAPQQP
jgi:hypothetical protein